VLALAELCEREGLFDAAGHWMARGSLGRPVRRLAPVVFQTAARLRLRRFSASDRSPGARRQGLRAACRRAPRYAVAVLALTLAGFRVASLLWVGPGGGGRPRRAGAGGPAVAGKRA
jgi:hypothetical protein